MRRRDKERQIEHDVYVQRCVGMSEPNALLVTKLWVSTHQYYDDRVQARPVVAAQGTTIEHPGCVLELGFPIGIRQDVYAHVGSCLRPAATSSSKAASGGSPLLADLGSTFSPRRRWAMADFSQGCW